MATRRKSTNILTTAQRWHLTFSRDYLGSGFTDDEEMREAWRGHKAEIIERAKEDPVRAHWPTYGELRFDRGLSHEEALTIRHKKDQA